MVTIIGYVKRQGPDAEFFLLQLQGDMEVLVSAQSGRPYATAKKCKLSSTFDEPTCKAMIGKTIPGSIIKLPVEEPYEYQIPNSEEVITLDYIYSYSATEPSATMEQAVLQH